jgi:hypothetical protein
LATDFDVFFIGFGLLGFGGPALHLGVIHLSNLYPGNKVRRRRIPSLCTHDVSARASCTPYIS